MAKPAGYLEVPGLVLGGDAPAPVPAAPMPAPVPEAPAPAGPGFFGGAAAPVADQFGIVAQGAANLGETAPRMPSAADPFGLLAPRPAAPAQPYMTPWRREAPAPAAPIPAVPAPRPMGGGMPAPRGPGSFELAMQGKEAGLEGVLRLGETQLQAIDIERQRAQREADFFAEQAKADADRMAEDTKRQAQLQADMDRRLTELDTLQAEVRSTKIDPSNYFSSQPAWAKVLSLISVGLGGFAQGYSGGRLPNTALAMLDKAIDQDIDAQRANLETKRGAVAQAQNMYGLARQRLGDDRAAADWVRSQQREMVANTLRRFEAEARDPQLQNQAAQLAAKYETQAQQGRLEIASMRAGEDERRRAAQAAAMAAAQRGPSLKDLEAIARIKKLEAETGAIQAESGGGPGGAVTGKAAAELQARYVPSMGAIAGSAKQADELNEGIAAAERTKQILGEMKRLRLEGSTGGFGVDRARYEALRTDAIASSNRAARLGALDKGTLDLLDKSIPEPALFSSDAQAAAKLDAASQALDTGRAASIRNTPLVPAQMVPTTRGPAFVFGAGGGASGPVTTKAGW